MSETATVFVAGVIIALMGWAISLLLKLNDKVTLINQWREGHEDHHEVDSAINAERHKDNSRQLAEIRREIRNSRMIRKPWNEKDDED